MSCPVEMLYSVQYQDTVCQEIVFLAGRILLLKRIKCFLTPSERVDAKKQCFWHLSAWRDARNVVYRAKRRGFRQYIAFLASRRPD